jgi:hypothetical protein
VVPEADNLLIGVANRRHFQSSTRLRFMVEGVVDRLLLALNFFHCSTTSITSIESPAQHANARSDPRGEGQAGRNAIRESLGRYVPFPHTRHSFQRLTHYIQRTHSLQPSSQHSSSPNMLVLSRRCPCCSHQSSSSAPTSTSTASRLTVPV